MVPKESKTCYGKAFFFVERLKKSKLQHWKGNFGSYIITLRDIFISSL